MEERNKFSDTQEYAYYLKDIAKNDIDLAKKNKNVYIKALFSDDEFLKASGLFFLLFKMKLNSKEIIKKAIELLDEKESETVINWAIIGLTEVYFGQIENEVVLKFLNIFNTNKNIHTVDLALNGLLSIFFKMSQHNIFQRCNFNFVELDESFIEQKKKIFFSEIKIIKDYIESFTNPS